MTRPFRSVEEEAILSIARTAALIEHAGAESLKPFNLTFARYEVLMLLPGGLVIGVDDLMIIGDTSGNRVYWGDLHAQTEETGGTGTLDESV